MYLRSLLTVVALLVSAQSSAYSSPQKSCGEPARVRIQYRTANALNNTSSPSFVEMPDASVTFTPTGGAARCAVVRFSAILQPAVGTTIWVQVVLDGKEIARPGPASFIERGGQSFEFVFADVRADKRHRVAVQWRSSMGTAILVAARTLTVIY
jgi:hypothetical protein